MARPFDPIQAPAPSSKSVANVATPGLMPLAMTVVIVAALYFAREILIPITLALLLTFVLAPLVNFLRRLGLGSVTATMVAVLLALGVILGVGAALGTQVAQLAQDLPRYQGTIHQKIDAARELTLGQFGTFLKGLGDQKAVSPLPTENTSVARETPPLPVEVREPVPSPIDLAERIVAPVVGPLANLGIVLVVTIFVLLQREDLRDRLIRLVGSRDLHRTTAAMDDAGRRLSKYFLAQLGLNASFGIIVATGLYFIGVPSFIVWGILGMLMRFVPYIGAALSALPPVILAAAVDPGWSMVVWTLALYLVVDVTIGQAIEPLVYGHSTGLSPVAVVISAVFWTWLWGSMGLLLSTPLTLCLVVLGRHIERLEFIDVILGDRPPLTPVQNFYQRLLAGDPDEIVTYAEVLLKDTSLGTFYDDVAMGGLRLAAEDVARGVLEAEQIERIISTMTEIIADLDEYDDVDPIDAKRDDGAVAAPESELALVETPTNSTKAPPMDRRPQGWTGASPIMCIAGRGPLDICAAKLLAQLLEKHELGAVTIPNSETSSITINSLDMSETAAVCICSLSIVTSAPSTHSLIRRLQRRSPSALILAGFELQVGAETEAETLGTSVKSLHDAVQAFVEAASGEQPKNSQ